MAAHRSRPSLLVSSPLFVGCWCLVLGIHITAALFALFVGASHLLISLPAIHSSTSALMLSVNLKRLTGSSYLVIATFHIKDSFDIIRGSIRRKQLAWSSNGSHDAGSKAGTSRVPIAASTAACTPTWRVMRGLIFVKDSYLNVFGPQGTTSIGGHHFWSLLLFRELLEVLTQTYQVWSMSYYVSRVWINEFAVATVVTSCWSMPLLKWVFRNNEPISQLTHLIADMCLDFTLTVFVPVIVLVPYVLQYDWKISEYPPMLILSDVWFANAIAEAKQVLVVSYPDFFSSLLPQVSILSCLDSLKHCIRRSREPTMRRFSVTPLDPTAPPPSSSSTPVARFTGAAVRREGRATQLLSTLIAAWGVAVLALHLEAKSQAVNLPGCRSAVRPWRAQNSSCMVLHVDCLDRDIAGSAGEVADTFNRLERTTLAGVSFLHCPSLTVPTIITQFSLLRTIEIYNSTLLEWPAEASIRQSTHPLLANVYITKTNLTRVPAGLETNELPSNMASINFLNSSLVEIPAATAEMWGKSSLGRVSLEGTLVQQIPRQLGGMNMRKVWMTGNRIEELPDDLLLKSRPVSIRLSGNPLRRLPSSGGDTSKLLFLAVEHTNVSSLPGWITDWLARPGKKVASFYGSPVCEPGVVETLAVPDTAAVCGQDLQTQYGVVPEAILKALHPVRQDP